MKHEKPDKSYYPSLDGLRGLAASMVVYGHAGYFSWVPLLAGCASIGVMLFFFLSGFLMGVHYLPAGPGGVRYWSSFVCRRFMRVYPPYLFAPIFGYLLLCPAMPPTFEHEKLFGEISIFNELIKIAVFRGDPGIYWTVKLELMFYILYPFIIILSTLMRRRAAVLLFLIVALMAANHLYGSQGVAGWVVHFLGRWPGYISIFAAGVFTAVVSKVHQNILTKYFPANRVLATISISALVFIVAIISRSEPTHDSIWKLDWLFALLFFVMFTSIVRSDGFVTRLLSSRCAVMLGKASYSLYLIHIVAFYLYLKYFSALLPGIATTVIVLIVLTLIYYNFVEKIFIGLSRKIAVNI